MKNIFLLNQIRENERRSHTELYNSSALYQENSWLRKPVKTVLDQIPLFRMHNTMSILDLGCGVGRNAIALAKEFSHIPCHIDCIDILDIATQKLMDNARDHGVSHIIHGITAPIEAFSIPENHYDWILAVSSLEHIDSIDSFIHKLMEIKKGIRKDGIVCLILNSEVKEFDKDTGLPIPAQFEVNLPTSELEKILAETFSDWETLKHTIKTQQYDIPRDAITSDLHTNVVTYVAKNKGNSGE